MTSHLLEAYAVLVDAYRAPRKKADMEEAVAKAMRAVHRAIVETGGDPDAALVARGPLPPPPFAGVLYVSREQDTSDGEYFYLAHEHGVTGLADGEGVGVYQLTGTGRVRVTTELVPDRPDHSQSVTP